MIGNATEQSAQATQQLVQALASLRAASRQLVHINVEQAAEIRNAAKSVRAVLRACK